ncbi:MAG: hypothetical protein QXT25_01500 [Candidatus Anstonellaceae archaeon]
MNNMRVQSIPDSYWLHYIIKLFKKEKKAIPFIEHNNEPFSNEGSRRKRYKELTQRIADAGFGKNASWLSLTVSQKISQMKSLKDEYGKSAYEYVFDAAKIFGVKPSALLSIIMCENSNLDVRFENKKSKNDSDKGLMQISDETRLSLNQPAVAQRLASFLGQKKLEELGRLFGLEYSGGTLERFASRIIEKITGYNSFSGKLSLEEAFKLKHNIFAGAIYFFINLKDFEHNYVLAAFSYNAGRRRLNNFLDAERTRNPERQKEAEQNGINYASQFWGYFCVFESYFAGKGGKKLALHSQSSFESINKF